MKLFNILSFSAITAIGMLSGCSSSRASSTMNQEEVSKQLRAMVDEYFEAILELNPLFATSIGDHRFDDQMTISISKEFREKQMLVTKKYLEKGKGISAKKLGIEDSLTYAMFMSDLQSDLDLQKVDIDYLMPFNQFSSFFSDFAELASGSSFVTFDTALDYTNFLKRSAVVPAYIDTMIANMQEGISKGITTPKILVEEGLKQLQSLLVPNYKESVFYQPLLTLDTKVKGEEAAKIKASYESMIQNQIYPSYKKLEEYVAGTYLSQSRTTDGLAALPGGKEFYRALVRNYTTTDLTPEEIHKMGISEVERIQKEFESVKDQMGFNGDLPAFFASLKEKTPKLYPFHTAQEVIDAYFAIYKKVMEKIPDYFHLKPKAKFEIRQVEDFKAENASEAYQPAAGDGSRPGIFWVPIPHPTEYAAKDMECLFLHEAIPGHHFQISIQQELPHLSRYRKFMGNTSYIEGWALYAESLGKDLGMYTDPIQWVGRLTLEMHRAIRLVVDTGLHFYGWSRDQAVQYSLDHEPTDVRDVKTEIDRYMAIPGQAVSYKVGELKIQELKKRAKQMLITSYTDWEFNDEIIQNGSLPLSVLDAEVDRFIKEKLSGKLKTDKSL